MGDVSDGPFVPPNAQLCVLSYTVHGAQRCCTDWEQRRMATLFPVTGPPFPLGLGEGQGQQPHTIAPGTMGASSLWGREGHREERAGGLFLEGQQGNFLDQSPCMLLSCTAGIQAPTSRNETRWNF